MCALLLVREYLTNLWYGTLRGVLIGALAGVVLVGAAVPGVAYLRARDDLADHREVSERLAACQRAAETGASLNDAWHTWLDDRTGGPARHVEQLAGEHDALLDDCRGDNASVLVNDH